MLSAAAKLLRVAASVPSLRQYSFGIPGLVTDCRHNVEHTPLFFKEVLKYTDPAPGKTFLDMTFGSGGHTSLLLGHSTDIRVVASDCDRSSFQAATDLAARNPAGALTPLRARFSELPAALAAENISSVDAVIVDTGCSSFQWADRDRGFCFSRKGSLDLRMDGDLRPTVPTASQVLQMTEERRLWKMLRLYGGMKQRAKYVANAVIEARYMFHQFQTLQVRSEL